MRRITLPAGQIPIRLLRSRRKLVRMNSYDVIPYEYEWMGRARLGVSGSCWVNASWRLNCTETCESGPNLWHNKPSNFHLPRASITPCTLREVIDDRQAAPPLC